MNDSGKRLGAENSLQHTLSLQVSAQVSGELVLNWMFGEIVYTVQ